MVTSNKPESCRYCGRSISTVNPIHQKWWPFCSERCKMADLGLWFSDRYVVSRPTDEAIDDAGVIDEPIKNEEEDS